MAQVNGAQDEEWKGLRSITTTYNVPDKLKGCFWYYHYTVPMILHVRHVKYEPQ